MRVIPGAMVSDPSQRVSARVKAPLVQDDLKVSRRPALEQVSDSSAQETRAPVKPRPAESQRLYFPSEGAVHRFRGDVTGRGVGEVSAGQGISRLPRQVQPFDPSLSSEVISSLNQAELAAIGATPGPARGSAAQGVTARGEALEGREDASTEAAGGMISSFNPAELAAMDATPRFIIGNLGDDLLTGEEPDTSDELNAQGQADQGFNVIIGNLGDDLLTGEEPDTGDELNAIGQPKRDARLIGEPNYANVGPLDSTQGYYN